MCIDPYFVTVDLSKSWDWRSDNFTSINAIPRPQDTTVAIPPSVMRSALYQGATNDQFHLYGGTVFQGNISFPNYTPPSDKPGSLWSYDVKKQAWSSSNITAQSPIPPNHGAYADAPNLGLGFYLGGQLDRGSGGNIGLDGNSSTKVTGLIVVNTTSHSVFNVSIGNLDKPDRVGGSLLYVANVGRKGVLVAIGGVAGYARTDSSISGSPYRIVGPDGGGRVRCAPDT